jgi:hypothetical protein
MKVRELYRETQRAAGGPAARFVGGADEKNLARPRETGRRGLASLSGVPVGGSGQDGSHVQEQPETNQVAFNEQRGPS